MKYLALWVWLIVPITVWQVLDHYGTPHVMGGYRSVDPGGRHIPHHERYLITCTYYGWLGKLTLPSDFGACLWVRMMGGRS